MDTKFDKIDLKHEKELAKEKLKATPDTVSATSSIHPVFGEVGAEEPEERASGHGGISSDLKTIRDTFNLSEVPRQALVLGFAGVLPYLGTSLATVGVAYEINHAHEHGVGYLMHAETAEHVLHLLEPLQVGYGAVIISFLGAIHWGLEWANYGGHVGYPRYMIGVLAPAVAWPSVLLPVQYALIAQFLAFNFLYYADSRASRRGWAPPWYGTYRFVLTFIVGVAIVVSLIGRGELIGRVGQVPSPIDRVRQTQAMQEKFKMEEEHRRLDLIASGEAKDGSQESLDDGDEEEGGDDKRETGEEKKKKADDKEVDQAGSGDKTRDE